MNASYVCHLCEVLCESKVNYEEHVVGKKHRKMVEQVGEDNRKKAEENGEPAAVKEIVKIDFNLIDEWD